MNVRINQTLAGLKEPPGRFSQVLVFLKKRSFTAEMQKRIVQTGQSVSYDPKVATATVPCS